MGLGRTAHRLATQGRGREHVSLPLLPAPARPPSSPSPTLLFPLSLGLSVSPAGPAHPYSRDGLAAGLKNHFVGHVEDAHMHPIHFEQQYHNFHALGFGEAPSGIGEREAGRGGGFCARAQ